MKTADAIALFDSVKLLAESLGITREAVYQWGDTVPPLRAYQIREIAAKQQAAPAVIPDTVQQAA